MIHRVIVFFVLPFLTLSTVFAAQSPSNSPNSHGVSVSGGDYCTEVFNNGASFCLTGKVYFGDQSNCVATSVVQSSFDACAPTGSGLDGQPPLQNKIWTCTNACTNSGAATCTQGQVCSGVCQATATTPNNTCSAGKVPTGYNYCTGLPSSCTDVPLPTCATNEIMKHDGTAWQCADDLTGLGAACTTQGDVLKWDTVTSAFVCQADDVGTGALPTTCTNGQIALFDGTTWTCGSPSVLSATNGLNGADGLVGQNGWDGTSFSTDDDYCDNGEVLTWREGLYDYNGDGAQNSADDTNGDNVLTSDDRLWVCEAANGSNYWTKDVNNKLSYTAANVGVGVTDPGYALEVDNEFFLSHAGNEYFHVDATGLGGLPEVVLSNATNMYVDNGAVAINPSGLSVLTSGLGLDVQGKIGANQICYQAKYDHDNNAGTPPDFGCIDAALLPSLAGADKNGTACTNGSMPQWDTTITNADGTTGAWNCVTSTASGVALASPATVQIPTTRSYQALATACGASAYMCSDDDVLTLLMNGVSIPDYAVINAGAPGNFSTMANDCNGWSTFTSSSYFSYVVGEAMKLASCNMISSTTQILCCQ